MSFSLSLSLSLFGLFGQFLGADERLTICLHLLGRKTFDLTNRYLGRCYLSHWRLLLKPYKQPCSSGYGRPLMFKRLTVRIPAPYTGWTWHFSHFFPEKNVLIVWKDENKRKRCHGWPIFNSYTISLRSKFFTQLGVYTVPQPSKYYASLIASNSQ